MTSSESTENYPFDEYICGVTWLTCCGCSLYCGHRKEKMLIDKIKKIRKQYGFPLWLIKKALEYYDENEDKAIEKLIEIYSAVGDHPDVVVKRNIEKFKNEFAFIITPEMWDVSSVKTEDGYVRKEDMGRIS